MRRFFSHYSFIYPDVYLKNAVVEIDEHGRIMAVFPFDREIEKTIFVSGWLFFIPDKALINNQVLLIIKAVKKKEDKEYSPQYTFSSCHYRVYDSNGNLLII